MDCRRVDKNKKTILFRPFNSRQRDRKGNGRKKLSLTNLGT